MAILCPTLGAQYTAIDEDRGYFILVFPAIQLDDTNAYLEETFDSIRDTLGNTAQITFREFNYFGLNRTLDFIITREPHTVVGRLILDKYWEKLYVVFQSFDDAS